jgi:hypothetical protein
MSETRETIRTAISNAYYDARNNGHTMEQAADDATDAVLGIVAEIDRNARAYGWDVGHGRPLSEQLESHPDNPFMDPDWSSGLAPQSSGGAQ